ncbi:unnamed protein product [Clonostachys solani]|uniref:Uncharacterized protein n=1 Tax=Clonostachys solani TaxID=160281 RepID=A0A9N9YVC2_9HYPO|nr:unnamed protein product [Clonostachys solani]
MLKFKTYSTSPWYDKERASRAQAGLFDSFAVSVICEVARIRVCATTTNHLLLRGRISDNPSTDASALPPLPLLLMLMSGGELGSECLEDLLPSRNSMRGESASLQAEPS